MSDKIIKALDHQFNQHRIIFWYDEDAAMEEIYNSYSVPEEGLKLELENNEFQIRYQALKEYPERKILIYSRQAKPEPEDNWLLDLNLGNIIFASDESAMVLQELELNEKLLPVLREYPEYFRNRKERLEPLKNTLHPQKENEDTLKIAMISVLCGTNKAERENRKAFPEIILNVLLDVVEKGNIWTDICKYNLNGEFWRLIEREFGYTAEKTPDALLNHILTTLFQYQLGEEENLYNGTIYAHFDTWRKNLDYKLRVQDMLGKKEKELNVKGQLSALKDIQQLLKLDLYKETDNRIFTNLFQALMKEEMEISTALQIIIKRRETYWYKTGDSERLINHYQMMYSYLLFKEKLQHFEPSFKTVDEGWDEYISHYYEIDSEYRKFLQAFHQINTLSELDMLQNKIEKEYTEDYLQPLADRWQTALEKDPGMELLRPFRMTGFFFKYLISYLHKNQSVFIIISDGLRYEMGAELAGQITQKNRFEVKLSAIQSPVPTYTQLGMAALLPHKELTISENGINVLADGQSTTGLENRMAVIQKWLDANFKGKTVRGMAAKDFTDLSRAEQNDFIRGIDLVFLYSAGADAVGDNVKTEEKLPKGAQDEINYLEQLCSHIGKNLSRAHIVVTADHGFLFRKKEVPDTELTKMEKEEKEVHRDRRYILSPSPITHPAADILTDDQVEWKGSFRLQLARGVNRFRKPGGGTRYVHGGRMPQELCVPVLAIRKSRSDDTSQVDVAVLDRQNRITTGLVSVSFFQEQAVEEKMLARELEVRFESADGAVISNIKKLIFDKEDPIDHNRSRKEDFIFTTQADKYNGQVVVLKLYDIRSGGTLVIYREYNYHLQKKLQMEIDF